MRPFRPIAVLIFFFLSVVLFARDITVVVEDEDLAMPLEGAVVVLRGGARFICDENGIAKVTLPDDRQTILSITYPGYETYRLSIPAFVAGGNERFTASLHLGGVMTSQELVLEAARPETSETKSGRSVAISDRDLERTAEIGIIEDVMNSVKLLPGVGYSGMFSAMPSIRGGDPGDLMAALDGFYLEQPYHWLGSISIFNPKMVSSARLSHGVFSARYGHTISGLLEVTSKTPSPTETEIEAAIGSSAASLNLSLPLNGKGGILFMGNVTYWDTLIYAAQGLSTVIEDETLDLINAITTSPYIRSAAVSMNYRFTPDLDWRLNAFFGSDGVGAKFETDYSRFTDDIDGTMEIKADYNNYQGFLISGLTASPLPKLALRFTGGVGFIKTIAEGNINNDITAQYNPDFLNLFDDVWKNKLSGKTYTAPNINAGVEMDNAIFNAQGRADADIDLGHGFIAALGIQELYSQWAQEQDISLSFIEIPIARLREQSELIVLAMEASGLFPIVNIPGAALIRPMSTSGSSLNHGLTTSAYALIEYTSPNQRFGTELGLRLDHLYFVGDGFDLQNEPALNPRLNIDVGLLKNRGIFESITATIGTGLFSSMNSLISYYDPQRFVIGKETEDDDKIKFNRSWTSVVGFKFDFHEKYSFNIEGYYKRVFDRAYITAPTDEDNNFKPTFNFDGVGNVWGFDLQLQKMESRYWDGWISYTFTWAKYHDPSGGEQGISMGSTDTDGESWYYPSFHRFHNANIVMNIKPLRWFNIAVRFGFASGQPKDKVDEKVYPYPVQVVDKDFRPQVDENGEPIVIQKYRRNSWYDENERTAWSLPLDVKLSFFPTNRNGRASMEIYVAAENLLSVVYKPEGNTTFNEYTGQEDTGTSSGTFDIPIPMVSFGVKWRY